MIGKDRTEKNGLTSCEALLGHINGWIEENHEILQSVNAVSINTSCVLTHADPNTSYSFCLTDGILRVERGSKIVAGTSLAAPSEETS
jgi:hypothetical protein